MQYTSGSTGNPKGVPLTHANISASVAMMIDAYAITAHDVGVFWLPPYHDMGLMGALLTPLIAGFTSNLIEPAVFAREPETWIQSIAATSATLTAAPNFAFDLAINRLQDPATLDLSALRLLINGAEKVRPYTVERFETALRPAGLRQGAIVPSYGMAEATLLVAARRLNEPNSVTDGHINCGVAGAGIHVAVLQQDSPEANAGANSRQYIFAPALFENDALDTFLIEKL